MGKGLNRSVRSMIVALCFIIVASFMPYMDESSAVYASGGYVKTTVYDEVIKVNGTVYCAGAKGIYKVKLRNGKVKSAKILAKTKWPPMGNYAYIYSMKKKGSYIYYLHGTEAACSYMYKVNIKSGKKKKLATLDGYEGSGYAIKGKRIYYEDGYNESLYRPFVKSMKLNGKSKQYSSVQLIKKSKISNKKGYSVIIKQKGAYAKDYLKTPKGKFYLGKIKVY